MTKKAIVKFNNQNKLSFRRKLRIWSIRSFFIGKIVFFTLLYLFLFTPYLKFIKESISENLYELGGDIGFTLETVVIKGNSHIDTKEIIAALNADVGTPLFAIPLDKIHSKLKEISWIKDVTVRRSLPKAIIINITERLPIAIWQHQKTLSLIDADGNAIKADKINDFVILLHVVGVDANLHTSSLIEDLKQDPNIAGNVVSAVRYGERRWNLILKQNITVKMPETGFDKALKYLSKLAEQGKLFDQNYKVIDLRDSAKYYVEKY